MAEEALLHIGDDNFEEVILKADKPALVDFWAPWCGPCRMVGPVLEKMAAGHPDAVSVIKINVDVNQELAARYGIMSIPTVIMFKDGKLDKQLIGARQQKDYEQEFGL